MVFFFVWGFRGPVPVSLALGGTIFTAPFAAFCYWLIPKSVIIVHMIFIIHPIFRLA
jgi:hypothetical protein